jgi:hypothetical protein
VLEIIGLKAITLKELNWLTLFLMLLGNKQKDVTVFKDFKSLTHLEVELGLVWEHS